MFDSPELVEGGAGGVEIEESQFRKLPVKDQLTVIYKNMRADRQEQRRMSFHQKVQYVILGSFGIGMTIGLTLIVQHVLRGG